MKYLSKLPNYRRAPPGLELKILKKMPIVLFGGTVVPLFFSLASRVYPLDGTAQRIARQHELVDILSIASVLAVWMTVLTIAIGCITVVLMKGPAYVADAYDLVDSERPATGKINANGRTV